jgi:hypothetical protein
MGPWLRKRVLTYKPGDSGPKVAPIPAE